MKASRRTDRQTDRQTGYTIKGLISNSHTIRTADTNIVISLPTFAYTSTRHVPDNSQVSIFMINKPSKVRGVTMNSPCVLRDQ